MTAKDFSTKIYWMNEKIWKQMNDQVTDGGYEQLVFELNERMEDQIENQLQSYICDQMCIKIAAESYLY